MVHCTCIHQDTNIKVRDGYKKVRDVIEGDEVLGSDGNWHIVMGNLLSSTHSQKKLISIKGEIDDLRIKETHKVLVSTYRDQCACGCGKKLRPISDNGAKRHAHELYDRRKFIPKHHDRNVNDNFDRVQWKEVKELKAGDMLLTPIVKGTMDIGDDYCRMLGYYLAEGHCPERGRSTVITLNVNEFNTIATDIVNYFTSVGIETKYKYHKFEDRNWLTVTIYSTEFRNDCMKYCGKDLCISI